jgi:hypothetical protein
MTAAAQTDVARRVVGTSSSNQLYVRLAYASAAVAVIGFAPSYWIPLITGRSALPPILHLHALAFYGWLALFIAQTRFAAARQLTRHREFGVLGVSVATAMCFIGLAAAIHSMRSAVAAGHGDVARAFSIVPISGIALFAVTFAVALLNVKRVDVHKRMLLIATVGLLQAAIGRVFILFITGAPATVDAAPPPVAVTILPGLIGNLLIVAAMLHDRKHIGRVHRTYWTWGAVLLAVQLLRAPLSNTSAWLAIADAIEALAP